MPMEKALAGPESQMPLRFQTWRIWRLGARTMPSGFGRIDDGLGGQQKKSGAHSCSVMEACGDCGGRP